MIFDPPNTLNTPKGFLPFAVFSVFGGLTLSRVPELAFAS